ncbi:MAG TPA: DNA-binding response regulator [Polyangiaceae bacterium]|nr:DNA-binding response regulator [Polyangiaceae bacterium]
MAARGDKAPRGRAPDERSESPEPERPSVLLVEDDAVLAVAHSRLLDVIGYRVLGPVMTAKDAISAVAMNPPAVVLMDVGLSGDIDGLTAAREIREHTDVPIVFISGRSDDGALDRAVDCDASAFLLKPVELEQLRATLKLAVGQGATRAKERWLAELFTKLADALPVPLVLRDDSSGASFANIAARAGGAAASVDPSPATDPSGVAALRRGMLSLREREVLDDFLRGLQIETIARRLFISPQTVRNHLKRIGRRFGVHGQAELRELFARARD